MVVIHASHHINTHSHYLRGREVVVSKRHHRVGVRVIDESAQGNALAVNIMLGWRKIIIGTVVEVRAK